MNKAQPLCPRQPNLEIRGILCAKDGALRKNCAVDHTAPAGRPRLGRGHRGEQGLEMCPRARYSCSPDLRNVTVQHASTLLEQAPTADHLTRPRAAITHTSGIGPPTRRGLSLGMSRPLPRPNNPPTTAQRPCQHPEPHRPRPASQLLPTFHAVMSSPKLSSPLLCPAHRTHKGPANGVKMH